MLLILLGHKSVKQVFTANTEITLTLYRFPVAQKSILKYISSKTEKRKTLERNKNSKLVIFSQQMIFICLI